MSRAFVREDSGPVLPEVAELPLSPHPNWERPAFLEVQRARREEMAATISALRAGRDTLPDLMPLAVAERDLRWLDARLGCALPVDPAAPPADRVGFGATVTVADEDGANPTLHAGRRGRGRPGAGAGLGHFAAGPGAGGRGGGRCRDLAAAGGGGGTGGGGDRLIGAPLKRIGEQAIAADVYRSTDRQVAGTGW